MNANSLPRIRQIAVAALDNGTEVLWAEAVNESSFRLLSVPVFVYGISMGAVLRAEPGPNGILVIVSVLSPSQGATIRCYVPQATTASVIYRKEIVPRMTAAGLLVGPVTFLDPDVVAIHVKNRRDAQAVGRELDFLAAQNRLRFWEVGDPAMAEPKHEEEDTPPAEAWELIHDLPTEGGVAEARLN